MGSACTTSPGTKKHSHRSSVKLLLLGTGDAGKSTFVKSLQIAKTGTESVGTEKFAKACQENCLESMKTIVKFSKIEHTDEILELLNSEVLTEPIAKIIVDLWSRKEIKELFKNRADYGVHLSGNCDYFFQNAERFAKEDFVPNSDDIVRAKLKTTGKKEICIDFDGTMCTLIDVGGQRPERAKWPKLFEDITGVIFIAALDEYDMKLAEDQEVYRLSESLNLFHYLVHMECFASKPFILFLNKSDLFARRIKEKPLYKCFEDFTEDKANYKASVAYIRSKYSELFPQTRTRTLYTYITCAVDCSHTNRIFLSVKDTILRFALSDAGVF